MHGCQNSAGMPRRGNVMCIQMCLIFSFIFFTLHGKAIWTLSPKARGLCSPPGELFIWEDGVFANRRSGPSEVLPGMAGGEAQDSSADVTS